ncbi:diguanylate cyclase [Novimethylophilus kurashikiensis]|uniref:Diguanylate cyclase n=1 Tax=Novimethylophilus kurashikiensis TaxID=1825523 RepID=A0A2R5FFJ9_9PROT|nr:EAL domain-containing protein [Novimethylophilus kurashikiensis]GBG15393.1 diguanylate cyclase [Novimethylophilus kurashikiensis]
MTPKLAPFNKLSPFLLSLWLTLVAFVAFSVTFVGYIRAQKQIDIASEIRYQSYQLADELRQSSDDLTRMARTYVAIGEARYKQHYQEILDIRNGVKPRPVNYDHIYWDLVLEDDRRPRPYGPAVPLLQRMRDLGFTAPEFAKLQEAKLRSDALTKTEYNAMALVESSHEESQRLRALQQLNDTAYHRAKAGIMQPISEFYTLMDNRTLSMVHASEEKAQQVLMLLVALGVLLVFLLWRVLRALKMTLGSHLDDLHARIVRLGKGDLSTPIPVPDSAENSITGWLEQTRHNLNQIDSQRQESEAANQRLTQLYAALSQCNQAIVRCQSETELLPLVCRDAVEHGGMKMAWIGMKDPAHQVLRPVAYYGDGVDYLENLEIAIDTHMPGSSGPTGRAFREMRPVWCQDFRNDATLMWRERSEKYGWQASASLPLHCNGEIVGTFNLYSSKQGAFDTQAQELLIEMAVDISHALGRFKLEKDHYQLELELKASEERSRLVLENSIDAVINIDREGRITEWNGAAMDIFGYRREEVLGKELGQFIIPERYRHAHATAMQRLAASLEHEPSGKRVEIEALRSDGSEFPVELSITSIRRNGMVFFSAFLRDISERKQAEARIRYLALFDALTGLPNRTQLEERIAYAISLAKRNNGHIALVFLDLDHFKNINDTLGHSVGDRLLIEIAARLQNGSREQDTVARLGGDEFILLLPESNEDGVRRVAEKLLESITRPFIDEKGNELTVSSSIGIAFYPNDGEDFETLLKNADTAMYRAKKDGRNGYCFFTPQMQARSVRNLEVENALRQAVARNQLELYYQPQISAVDGKLIGAEALLRWHNPELGFISPAEFIPIAEESGLILSIGEWVLRTALTQLKSWIDRGMSPIIVAVNLSAIQFRHATLPQLVSTILDELQLPPEFLELELTESAAMHDPVAAIDIMNNLHGRGVRMSIDDFGTGYSSLSYLKKFKVYKLKIDQSFVRDISTDPEDKAIVNAVIQMAHSLGLKTIAEGVETESQLDFVRSQLCDEVQGYYFSKPLPAAQFEDFARRDRNMLY